MNIKDLLEQDGFSCVKVGNKEGGIYGSACPWCGGKDRFRSWPYSENGGNWYCQKCIRKGSAARYLTEYRKMTYQEACLLLEISPRISRGGLRSTNNPVVKPEKQVQNEYEPPVLWQSQANAFIGECTGILWNQCPEGVEWLHARGLNDKTSRQFNLGWNPEDRWCSREEWGLSGEINENGNPKKLWLPAGLVIPYERDAKILRIRIRKSHDSANSRYHLVRGSSTASFVIGNLSSVVIVESDLDAILINQEAGNLVTAISLGSANMRPDDRVAGFLKNARAILISLDCDEAGASSYWSWWKEHFSTSKRWPVPVGKDPGEAIQKGLNIRDWIFAGLTVTGGPSKKTNYGPIFDVSDGSVSCDDPQSAAEKLQKLQHSKNIIIDVQTTGADPFTHRIQSIQISDGAGVLVSLLHKDLHEGCRHQVTALLQGGSGKVFHDAKTQMKFLRSAGFEITGSVFDTMLAAQLLEAGVKDYKYDLASVSKRQLAKEDSNRIETIRELTRYQFTNLRSDGLSETAKLEFSCLPVVVDMELNGVLLDTLKWKELCDDLLGQKDQLEKALYDELGQINFDSPIELLQALRSKGIDISDTNRHTLASHSDQYPILKTVIAYRKVAKLVQGFILPLPKCINPKTGRIHPEYNQIGASTGRFSCHDPNLQQIPRDKRFRECIVASPGHLLIIADYSQIELRVAAEITGDERMVQAFQKGVDLHKLTAAVITSKQIDDVDAQERQAAKAVNFGLIFGMGADGLMDYARNTYGVSMSLDQARGFRTRFFKYYHGIGAWHERVQRSRALETRTIEKRRRLWNKQAPLTELLNTPVQGTAADIIKKALILIHNRLQGTGSRLFACVHDEIILEAPKEYADDESKILRESMVESGAYYLKKIPVEVDLHIDENWAGK